MSVDVALWLDDPSGVADFRRWDGRDWTDQVLVEGVQVTSPHHSVLEPPRLGKQETAIRHQVQNQAGVTPASDDTRVLVINHQSGHTLSQSAYDVFDQRGTKVGAARRFAEDGLVKRRRATFLDYYLRLRVEMLDLNGEVVGLLDRRRHWQQTATFVTDGAGRRVGTFVKVRSRPRTFSILIEEVPVAELVEQDRRGRHFLILDPDGERLGKIVKTKVSTVVGVMTAARRFTVERRTTHGSDLDTLLGYAPIALDMMLASVYEYETERELTLEPEYRI